MATVEELREKVLRYKAGEYVGRDIEDGYTTEDICIVHTDDLDSLIAAAREEGRAEERERIVCGSQRFPKGEYVVDSDYISMVFSPDGIGEAMTDCELFIIPASVLAPDKESEK